MTTGYIYNTDTHEILFILAGPDDKSIEDYAEELGYLGIDKYGLTYTSLGLEKTDKTACLEA